MLAVAAVVGLRGAAVSSEELLLLSFGLTGGISVSGAI